MWRKSVNSILVLYVLLSLIVGIGALVVYVVDSSHNLAISLQKRSLEQLAGNIAMELDDSIAVSGRLAQTLSIQSAMGEAIEGEPARASARFKGYMETYRGTYWAMFVFDAKGRVMAGYNANMEDMAGADRSNREYVKAILSGQDSFISPKMLHAKSGDAAIFSMACAVKDESGRTIGGVAIFPLSNVFFEEYIYPLRFGKRGYGFVVDSQGVVLAHAMDRSLIFQNLGGSFVREAIAAKTGVMNYDYNGEEKIMAFATTRSTGWTVCMSAYDSELAETATQQAYILAGAGLGVALLLALVITFLSRRLIMNPVHEIERFTQSVAAQDYTATFSGDFKYEIGKLAENIKTMVAELKQRLGFAQGLLNGMTISCLIAGPDEKLIFVNKAVIEFLGRRGDPEDFVGWTVSRFFYGEEGRPSITGRVLREGRPLINVPVEIENFAGKKVFTQADAAPLYDLDGNLIAGFALFSDLTELKRQQEEIREQNVRIAKAAEEASSVSELTASASEELSAQIEQSSRGAEIQRDRVREMVTAIEEMNATVLEVAKNASNAASGASESMNKAKSGAEVVLKVVEAIDRVQHESMGLKENMATLGEQAEGIGHIMNVISDIADQTNLLALNAAIEAARAGEAGRGFAVVADEVRKLAEKTMSATQEVGKAITDIQHGARETVARMDGAVQSVNQTTALAEQAGESLSEIVTLAEASSDQIRSIATASEEQSSASEEISRSAEDINRISSETAEAMEQSARAVTELAEQAGILGRLIRELQGEGRAD